jgi:hypothetical protein
MTRNLKALGLALMAVFAFAAITSSAAQATPQFTGYDTVNGVPGEHTHTILKGTTENIEPFAETFTAFGKIECHVTYEATSLTGVDTTLTVKPTAFKTPKTTEGTHCVATLAGSEFTVHVNFNSCDYVFHSGKKLKLNEEYTGTVDVHCDTPGDHIDLKVTKPGTEETKCTIKVPGGGKNDGLSHIIYRNERKPAGETHVTAEATVNKANGKGITYTSEGGVLNCGVANGEHVEAAEYEGKVTLEGRDTENKPLDIEVSGE